MLRGARRLSMRQAIRNAVWDWGVKGDSCALLAHNIIKSLSEAGFDISERSP